MRPPAADPPERYTELTLGDAGRDHRAEVRWSRGERFDLTLEGERRQQGGADAEHGVMLKARIRF